MICWDIDYDANAAYARLNHGDVSSTKEVAPGVLVDIDSNGEPVGLELLDLGINLSFELLVKQCGLSEELAIALCNPGRPTLFIQSVSVGRQGAILREPALA